MNYIWVNTENKNTHKSSILRMWKKMKYTPTWATVENATRPLRWFSRKCDWTNNKIYKMRQTDGHGNIANVDALNACHFTIRYETVRPKRQPHVCAVCVCVFVSQVNLFDLILWVCSGKGYRRRYSVDVVYFVVFIASNNDLIWCLAATMHTINVYKSFI